ncbi:2332_t:CDS:2 [Acaulospora colombiana]|uniref:2332_t:CDS:1 n=1 Tax=Acaulospora colombiana TaxID=27376 RepID=A0ACA9LQN5_9GLOM|nr:2332_t:CDS:2 [Acaulospora colombiana]
MLGVLRPLLIARLIAGVKKHRNYSTGFTRSSDVQGSEPSHEASVGAYMTYEVVLRSRLRADLTLALLGRIRLTRSSYVQGFEPTWQEEKIDRTSRSWDKERSYKNKSAEPSVHVHHPTFIGGGTVSGIINSETFISGSSEKDQKKAQDPVDNISAFFKDPSGVKVTNFIEKLRELSDDSGIISDDSKKTFNEEVKVEYESQNSPSVSDDDDSNYMPSDTDESASDTDASEDNINGKDLPKIDKTAFCKTYYAIPNSTKLQLSTGRIVEDILFEFAEDMDYEHHAHSYIVDFDDEIVRALFTDKEWSELIKDRNGVPSVPRDIAEELSKYGSKTLKELRTKVMKTYLKDDEEYDVQKHYNREWIQMTMRTLCNLFENIDTPLVRTQYEDWFTVALFGTCIDFCVRDAQLGTDIKRTDAPSLSSANRKNRRRKANARKLIGRKIDGIIYITNRLVEIGAIEGARAFAGVSDNKYLSSHSRCPKHFEICILI